MKKNIVVKMGTLCSIFFTFVLFVIANSNSSIVMHEEKLPEGIKAYKKIK